MRLSDRCWCALGAPRARVERKLSGPTHHAAHAPLIAGEARSRRVTTTSATGLSCASTSCSFLTSLPTVSLLASDIPHSRGRQRRYGSEEAAASPGRQAPHETHACMTVHTPALASTRHDPFASTSATGKGNGQGGQMRQMCMYSCNCNAKRRMTPRRRHMHPWPSAAIGRVPRSTINLTAAFLLLQTIYAGQKK